MWMRSPKEATTISPTLPPLYYLTIIAHCLLYSLTVDYNTLGYMRVVSDHSEESQDATTANPTPTTRVLASEPKGLQSYDNQLDDLARLKPKKSASGERVD